MFYPIIQRNFSTYKKKNANPLVHFIHVLVETNDGRNQNNGIIRVNIHNCYERMLVGQWDSHLPRHNLKIIYKSPLILKQNFDICVPFHFLANHYTYRCQC